MRKLFFSLMTLACFCMNGIGQMVEGGFYFFEHPVQNIFQIPYASPMPSGKDPYYKEGDSPTTLQIVSSKSAFLQTVNFSKATEVKILSSFSKKDSITLAGTFYNVKMDQVAEDGFSNVKDQNFHAIQALRADSVVITFKKQGSKSFGTADLQKAATALIPGTTVYGIISKAMGFDSTKSQLIGFSTGNNDSVKLVIKDSTIYFAARFIKFYEQKEAKNPIHIIFRESEFLAPNVENRLNNAPTVVHFPPNKSTVRISLFPDPTTNTNLKINPQAFLVLDTETLIGHVEFKNLGVTNGQQTKITNSMNYDFSNDFYNIPIQGSVYLYLESNKNRDSYLWLDYKLMVDFKNKQVTIYNRSDGNASGLSLTCIYTTEGKFEMWPK